jgi:hypothetical protein
MPQETAASLPGWYADPRDPAQLRFWDGGRWSTQVRPLPGISEHSPAGAAVDVDASGAEVAGVGVEVDASGAEMRERHQNIATLIVGLAIAFFAVAGLYEVISGNSSSNSNPNRFAGDTGTTAAPASLGAAPATAPLGIDCAAASRHVDAAGALKWLGSNGLPVSVIPAPAAPAPPTTILPSGAALTLLPPGSACTHATFADSRAAIPSRLSAYSTGFEARHAALSNTHQALVVYAGSYVIELAPGLAPFRGQYEQALRVFAAGQLAQVPATTAPPSAPTPAGPP